VTATAIPATSAWLEALSRELETATEEGLFSLSPALDTLYVGGGTPSFLGPEAMAAVASLLGPSRLLDEDLEWTSEANPESFSPSVAASWRRAGVNRVSIGIQSLDPSVLRWMGRLHDVEGGLQSVQIARAAGIDNISVDLMFGLPEEVERDLNSDLEQLLALKAPHVSVYGLTLGKASGLGVSEREERATRPSQVRYAEEFLEISSSLTGAGYHHYEVSNFALPGFESAHNRVYWELRPYLGLGNGAHSYLYPLRRWNLRGWPEYHEAALRTGDTGESREVLDDKEARLERVWLALRTSKGLDLDSAPETAWTMATRWVQQGWAQPHPRLVRLTPEGWLLLDRLAVELDSALE
jgi:oxygen-independent coproporphyrinogen-3 oxidase